MHQAVFAREMASVPDLTVSDPTYIINNRKGALVSSQHTYLFDLTLNYFVYGLTKTSTTGKESELGRYRLKYDRELKVHCSLLFACI
jgi:hypothetical protein